MRLDTLVASGRDSTIKGRPFLWTIFVCYVKQYYDFPLLWRVKGVAWNLESPQCPLFEALFSKCNEKDWAHFLKYMERYCLLLLLLFDPSPPHPPCLLPVQDDCCVASLLSFSPKSSRVPPERYLERRNFALNPKPDVDTARSVWNRKFKLP